MELPMYRWKNLKTDQESPATKELLQTFCSFFQEYINLAVCSNLDDKKNYKTSKHNKNKRTKKNTANCW